MSIELFPGCRARFFKEQSTQTISIDELLEERLRERASKAERVLEEIRPELEKALDEARDPVSREIIEEARVTSCSHTFDIKTICEIRDFDGRVDEDGDPIISCPMCRKKCVVDCIYYDDIFSRIIVYLKSIWGIFNKHDYTKLNREKE